MPILDKDESELLYEQCEVHPEICEMVSDLGEKFYKFFDPESLQKMMEIFEKLGLLESARTAEKLFYASEEYWADQLFKQTGKVGMYDPNVKRWRDMETGRFIPDPYKELWV